MWISKHMSATITTTYNNKQLVTKLKNLEDLYMLLNTHGLFWTKSENTISILFDDLVLELVIS